MNSVVSRGFCFAILMVLSAAGLSAAEFLPLAPGNNWTYQDTVTGSNFTVEIGVVQLYANNHVYHMLRGYTPMPVWVRINEYGNAVYWDGEQRSDVMLTAFETGFGGWFEAGARECPEQGQAQEKRGVHNGPAGQWSVLEIQYRTSECADTGDLLEQFAENIGMVRRVVNTIAGPRTFDLVHARLGALSISAGNAGGFSVTATQSPEPGYWEATLRVDQRSGDSLKVRFPSSQEYDLRLRDSGGNVVWTWSAGKVFDPTEHELHLFDGWKASVKVPIPPAPPQGPQAYTLEAWLTVADGEPRFAAATTVKASGTTAVVARRQGRIKIQPPGRRKK